jgi:hypothetical protein
LHALRKFPQFTPAGSQGTLCMYFERKEQVHDGEAAQAAKEGPSFRLIPGDNVVRSIDDKLR